MNEVVRRLPGAAVEHHREPVDRLAAQVAELQRLRAVRERESAAGGGASVRMSCAFRVIAQG